jgi:hypothetical protein
MLLEGPDITYNNNCLKGDLYIVILVEKEVSHYWKYGYQQYNAY